MSRLLVFPIAFLAVAISACASKPVADQYYSLVLAADNVVESISTTTEPALIVAPVKLPAYLHRRGLTIQSGPNQIQTANHHFWAEPLDEAIAKILARDIARLSGGLVVERDTGRWQAAASCWLRLEFDRFHSTSGSSVVASGRYWLSSDVLTVASDFRISRPLTLDGYAHAVAELRQILAELAESVVVTLQREDHCL